MRNAYAVFDSRLLCCPIRCGLTDADTILLGRAILRFEPSSLDVQLGQRVLLLRVLRLLDPIADRRSEGRTVMPVEGNLVKIKDMR